MNPDDTQWNGLAFAAGALADARKFEQLTRQEYDIAEVIMQAAWIKYNNAKADHLDAQDKFGEYLDSL